MSKDNTIGLLLFGVSAVAVYSYLKSGMDGGEQDYNAPPETEIPWYDPAAWVDAPIDPNTGYYIDSNVDASALTDDNVQISSGEYVAPTAISGSSEQAPGIFDSVVNTVRGVMGSWKRNEYPKYASAINETERRYSIPTDLLGRLLFQESSYSPDIIYGVNRSPVGATGIAQFMPGTAKEMGLPLVSVNYRGQVTQTYDPFASIDAAGRYLKRMYSMFNDWKLALMAYNWGPGHVQSWNQSGRGPIPKETNKYVAQITADVPVA